MVAVRFDRRLAARLDPSDVVQETLVEADRRLDAYLHDRPLPFYPWLRQLAMNRLLDARRFHIRADRRSVEREERPALPVESVLELADRLLAHQCGPGSRLSRHERREAVRSGLDRLPDRDREVLVLRFLEDLSTAEAAAVLGTGASTVKMRLVRALQRLRDLLGGEGQT
jgi:RNA polymerase sigma-70 factor (ECF subfamily)